VLASEVRLHILQIFVELFVKEQKLKQQLNEDYEEHKKRKCYKSLRRNNYWLFELMGLLKFVISAVISIIFLYFVITGIQNMMQAKEDLDLANERVDYWKGQVAKEHEFYRLHGCSKTGTESYSCPPGTPDFVPTEPEPN
jgi:hypothetical protein